MLPLHFIFGAVLGAVLAQLVVKMDKQHHGLSFSLLTLSLIKTSGVSYRVFQVVLAVLMGGIFVLNAQLLGAGWGLVFWQLISLLLVASAVYDLAFRLIPVPLIALLLLSAFLAPLLFAFPVNYWQAFSGGLIVGALVFVLYFVTRGQGIGEADVLLAVVIGLLFGWLQGLLVFSAANFLGLLVVLPLLAMLGKKRMKQIPLVFFLVLAIFIELYIGYTESVLLLIGVS